MSDRRPVMVTRSIQHLNIILLTSAGVLVWRAAKTGGFEMVRP
jgi:hypothetical protein